ncbi:DUF5133 domain-containing protein [Streptomyces sp. NPDC090025]|uniref:DUF5133 domain-containing protein n=1 Tax=Streptomyces sp. NPDC090025 TaxID=3365922 RepID=UPI0038367891
MLLPDRAAIDRLLRSYHALERQVVARPSDLVARSRFEDTTYTLCVLMGERSARAAVRAAEHYTAAPAPAPAPAP